MVIFLALVLGCSPFICRSLFLGFLLGRMLTTFALGHDALEIELGGGVWSRAVFAGVGCNRSWVLSGFGRASKGLRLVGGGRVLVARQGGGRARRTPGQLRGICAG